MVVEVQCVLIEKCHVDNVDLDECYSYIFRTTQQRYSEALPFVDYLRIACQKDDFKLDGVYKVDITLIQEQD